MFGNTVDSDGAGRSLRRIKRGYVMDWPTAAVMISVAIAVMVVLSTYIAGLYSKK
jgi:hypothetical protein